MRTPKGQKNKILRIWFIIFLRGFEPLCPVADRTPPHLTPRPHQPIMLTNVTIEQVRMLGQSETTSPGLLVLKLSSKSGLPITWITGHATIPQPSIFAIHLDNKFFQFFNHTIDNLSYDKMSCPVTTLSALWLRNLYRV